MGVGLEHASLEVLSNNPGRGIVRREQRLRMVVGSRLGLWIAKRVNSAEPLEGIEESDFIAVNREIGNCALEWPDRDAFVIVGDCPFGDVTAEQVPHQPPLHPGIRSKLKHPVLEILHQHPGLFLEDLGDRVAPPLQPTGGVEESQEIGGRHPIRLIKHQEPADVVGVVGVGDVSRFDHSRQCVIDGRRRGGGSGRKWQDRKSGHQDHQHPPGGGAFPLVPRPLYVAGRQS